MGLEQKLQKLIRFSLSRTKSGDIEIFSCETGTTLVLPQSDIALLIEALTSLHRTVSSPEIIYLDPSS